MNALENREVAGRLLAEKLSKYSGQENTLVLALPRGGIPIANEVAKALDLPWDLLFVKKICLPDQPNLPIGAITEDKELMWNSDLVKSLNVSKKELSDLARKASKQVDQKVKVWRGKSSPLNVSGQTIILIDDGMETGLKMKTVAALLQKKGVQKVIAAVPVAPESVVNSLSKVVDDVVVVGTPEPFLSVRQWYANFRKIDDTSIRFTMSEIEKIRKAN